MELGTLRLLHHACSGPLPLTMRSFNYAQSHLVAALHQHGCEPNLTLSRARI
jgi:hypothetical protein